MASFAPSTWRLLGLSVAACYAGFGLFEIVFPVRSARDLFQIPVLPAKKEGKPLPAGSESVHPAAATTGSEDVVPTLMPLLGARDVSIALALFTFAYQGRLKEMGVVIVAGTFLCATDTYVVWNKVSRRLGALFAAGTAAWTTIGLGMVYHA